MALESPKNPALVKRVVLTGGPGAGKTAVLELFRSLACEHVGLVQEAATLVFRGGFPRRAHAQAREAAQRAIFHVQTELETCAETEPQVQAVLCDRGTMDALAYWPGPPDTFWNAVHSNAQTELARYDKVIHLRTPAADHGYNHQNPLRTETAAEAAELDARILSVWAAHPHRVVIESNGNFLNKARQAMAAIQQTLPACCERGAANAARFMTP